MCDQCVEIDKKIEHYRFMASRISGYDRWDQTAYLNARARR
jgi:hypothetical protein